MNIADVLEQLDGPHEPLVPVLDHGYKYLAETRLTAYREGCYWGLIIETLICSSPDSGHAAIRNERYYFGNCLLFPLGSSEASMLHPTADGPEGHTFVSDVAGLYPIFLSNVQTVRVKSGLLPISHSPDVFARAGIKLRDPAHVRNFELLRWLAATYPTKLLADDVELSNGFSRPVKQLLQLTAWHHPNILAGERPSDIADFRQIAAAIKNADARDYSAPMLPNTHWSNWPMGGTL